VGITAKLVAEHGQAFVFCRTKRGADRVARQLREAGVNASAIHGDRTQSQRTHALQSFTDRRTDALVATDVVARGIHVEGVPCVVHFDPPSDANAYVHRSGRTGRVGHAGTVVSLVSDDLVGEVHALQRDLGFPIAITKPFDVPKVARSDGPARSASDPIGTSQRMIGTVKFFDTKRGFGFVERSDGSDVFVHHSRIDGRGTGRRVLTTGQLVSFELAHGQRGHEAHGVQSVRQG
jgi:superfamily II DNA/RNA helicase